MKLFCFRLILIFSCFFLYSATAAVQDNVINVRFDKDNTSNIIKFISTKPIFSAIFLNENRLWFVVDKQIAIRELDWRNTTIIKNTAIIEQTGSYTIGFFEIINPNDFEITAINQGNNILINITPYDNSILSAELSKTRKIIKNIDIKNKSLDIQLYGNKSSIVNFIDPFTQEMFYIIPESVLSRTSSKLFVDFKILSSLSGVIIQNLNDSIKTTIQNNNIHISSTSSLNISNSNDDLYLSSIIIGLDSNAKVILDLSQYNVKPKNFNTSLAKFNSLIYKTHEPIIKAERFFNLSLFLLANKWYLESKSNLELVNRYSDIITNDKIKMIVGAIYFMANIFNEAHDITQSINLMNINPPNKDEVSFWQKICSITAMINNYSVKNKQEIEFKLNAIAKLILSSQNNFLRYYNNDIFNKICFKVAESAIKVERFDILRIVIKVLSKIKLNNQDQKQFNYLTGILAKNTQDDTQALELFRNCMNDINDGYFYTRCKFEALDFMYKFDKLNNIEYINNLQGLSTVWRGDNFEFEVLDKLANFYYKIHQPGDAIRTWLTIASNYPDSYNAITSTIKASQAFIDYFSNSTDNQLTKLAFFYEFKDLIPLGAFGDDIIIQVIGYMLNLDMFDQAIKFIEYQIQNRLISISRENAINDLVNIYSHFNRWDLAEKAVELFSELPLNNTNPIIAERRYLYIRALINNNEIHDAIAMLYRDKNPIADDLRSQAFFKLGDWEAFNNNSEPYLYSIRNKQNLHLSNDDYIKILKQNISYFNNAQIMLLNDLYLDLQPRFKKNQKNAIRNNLFYQIANELNDSSEMNKDKKTRINELINQISNS